MPTRFTLLEYDRDVIRPRVLGKFRDLLGAVAHSPAMLYYLDNFQSVADSNHMTLPEFRQAERTGRRPGEPPPQRAQRELRPRAARAAHARRRRRLHAERRDRRRARAHRLDARQSARRAADSFSARGSTTPSRRSCSGTRCRAGRGEEDGEEVLDIVARHPATAHYIAFELARRFVSDTPSVGAGGPRGRDVPEDRTATSGRCCGRFSRAPSSSRARRIARR